MRGARGNLELSLVRDEEKLPPEVSFMPFSRTKYLFFREKSKPVIRRKAKWWKCTYTDQRQSEESAENLNLLMTRGDKAKST